MAIAAMLGTIGINLADRDRTHGGSASFWGARTRKASSHVRFRGANRKTFARSEPYRF